MTDPYIKAVPVTPHDTDTITDTDALLISVGGTLKVTMANGDVAMTAVPAGLLPIRVRRVFSAGTAATGITALYYKS